MIGQRLICAARKRQGQYLAALHRLKGAERTRVKAAARKDGVAVKVWKSFLIAFKAEKTGAGASE